MIVEPAQGPVQAPVHIELTGVSKRFGSTQAVDGVNLAVRRGAIHALVGENGAGKSTVGKVVSGLYGPDSGSLAVNGRPVRFRSPRHAFDAGITAIAQELALVPDRTVVDNVFLGVEATRWGWVRPQESRRRFRALAERTGIHVDPAARVDDLSVADQQCVEILRAVARRTELVVMDEPSARLSIAERDQLHRLVRSLRDQGITVLFISHFLDEVLALADEVTIMRDGRVVRTTTPSSETADSLVEAMIGRQLEATFPPKPALPDLVGMPALRVRGLRCTGSAREGSPAGLDLDVAAGEIVGIAGLVGSGRTEFLRAIYGADPGDGGEVVVGTQSLRGSRPDRAIRAGVGLIPESRKDHGLLIERSVRENVSLPHLARMTRAGVVNRIAERRFVRAASTDAGVRDGGMETPMRLLSGGNQQKCLFARWLVPGLRVLIADEPTRGVDVGSKRAIYDLIASAAADGLAVLVVSSDLEELVGLCHRILVMRDGSFVGEFTHPDLDEAELLRHAFGEASLSAAT
ncbi:sugar ABC transporter ATP-binding protein [Candidatus Poriferisodalis sp.]|uniref:sugar ABC transporter ATP-binding protein n=1 Tax=Candidatus Poriferisodalis sp. TaxID=3101277 RepID=UPI003B59D0E9